MLTELLAAIGVYRAYVVPGEPPPAGVGRATVTAAAAAARDRLPRAACTRPGRRGEPCSAAGRRPGAARPRASSIVRFQQTCGPVMAKGVEDTAFYRWSRLAALNEVGGEPGRLRRSARREFHAFAGAAGPATGRPRMTTLSTHDTKRQEDVRARLAVLAEMAAGVGGAGGRSWHERAAGSARGRAAAAPEPDTEYLLWQTLVGAWPIGPGAADRVPAQGHARGQDAHLLDGRRTTSYESAVLGLADAVLGDAAN